MTSRLTALRWQLSRLRRARAAARLAAAAVAVLASLIVALSAVFILDLLFSLAAAQRIVVLVLAGVGIAWAIRRFAWPLLRIREGEIEVALLVERQHKIDSDLVAALQFERRATGASESPQLAAAVIAGVAGGKRTIDVFAGFSLQPLARRSALLAVVLVPPLLMALLWPGYLAAFGDRLLLGSTHYPTRTRIDRIMVNDAVVFDRHGNELQPAGTKAAQGKPLTFVVECSGVTPSHGTVYLIATGDRASRTQIELTLGANRGAAAPMILQGELPRLNDSLTYTLAVGDAWTQPATIELVPLPIVEATLSATPPKYAARRQEALAAAGPSKAVLEGSSVDLSVHCTNGKGLASAWLTLLSAAGVTKVELSPGDTDGKWSAPSDHPLLSDIRHELRYEIQVLDSDGLGLDSALRGSLQVQPDHPPSSSIQTVHKAVMPAAAPVISYRASDDYGLSRMELIVEVERQSSSLTEDHRFDVADANQPLGLDGQPVTGKYALALAPLGLQKGDRLRLKLEATDYRGDRSGVSQTSEALTLEVTDEQGILAAISEEDRRSAERLTEIINVQLGVAKDP